MGAWHFLVLSAGKPQAHKIPCFRGRVLGFSGGGRGGSANFIFMGAGIFLIIRIGRKLIDAIYWQCRHARVETCFLNTLSFRGLL